CGHSFLQFLRSVFRFLVFSTTLLSSMFPLSLHDALPIYPDVARRDAPSRDESGRAPQRGDRDRSRRADVAASAADPGRAGRGGSDRKSTRLNSSHVKMSYACFCLKKKNVII